MTWTISVISVGLRPAITSSSSSRRGPVASARASSRRLRPATVRSAPIWSSWPAMPTMPATASASRCGQLAVGGAEVGADHDVLAHADLGERLGDLEGAHHAGGADAMRRQAGDVLAVEGDAAGIGRVEAGDGREQRRLARAVGPDQADDLALAHVERGLVDGLQAAERLGELAHLKHGAAFVRNRPISPSGRRATISTSMMP